MTGSASTPHPPSPYGSAAPAEIPPRPRPVEIAFWLYILTAALGVVGLILSASTYPALRAQALEDAQRQLEQQGQEDVLPPGTIETIADSAFGVGIATGVIGILLYVLFAIFVRRGANWARIVMTVLAGLSILGTLFAIASLALPSVTGASGAAEPAPGSELIGILQCLCLVAATVLIWLRPSNEWFRRVKEYRRARRDSAFGPTAPRQA
ncbi:hypothetical protein [Naasia sp. SYSU D00057]|uniref:hypothetical protein n=1 Tax=Naasia sp. SYSU D00057 TaxID=2817380 RepID=UPI001FEFCF6D|nr:hypothetical protein [Naasia sp. SYSU D00057]